VCREPYRKGLRRREEHQKAHWKVHRRSCYTKKHKEPPSPADVAIQYLLQFHDTAIVEISVMALLKEDIDVDFERELDRKAVVLTVEPREGDEEMAAAVTRGRIPPFKISKEVSVVSLEQEAQRRGLDFPFFEDPYDRQVRLARKQLGVAVIFQPGGRAITKRVPGIQINVWKMIQEKEKITTNPPMLYWQIMMSNNRVNMELEEEKKEDKK
jgi:hypothetical protein